MSNLLKMAIKHKTKFLALSLWLGIFILARLVMTINDFTFAQLADELVKILREAWYGPLLFILFYIARPILLMPGTVLILAAGMVYGLVGVPICLTADLLSATMVYSISRWFVNNKPQFEGRAGQFVSFMSRHPFEAVLTMQLSYISTDLISSMAGILQLPFRQFIIAVLIGGSVGNTLGVVIGSTIKGSVANGNISVQPEIVAISLAILAVSIAISFYLRQHNSESRNKESLA